MGRRLNLVWMAFMAIAMSATAQNTLPTNGNVGIGTTAPEFLLTVENSETTGVNSASFLQPNMSTGQFTSIALGQGMSGYDCGALQFTYVGAGSTQNFTSIGNCAVNQILNVAANGNVGIGTTKPLGTFQVVTPSDVNNGNIPTSSFTAMDTVLAGGSGSAGGVYTSYNQANNTGFIGAISPGVAWRNLVFNALGGNVGIGTPSPGARLEVNGTGIKLTSGSGGSVTYSDGSVQTTAWNGVLSGGDYAESVNISGDKNSYEPGDIIVINATKHGTFAKSAVPYSTLVAGIYSTKPGLLGRRQSGDLKSSTTEIPMAMVGIVPTKVSAENGPIKDGDLLVTSSTPGVAMKGTDATRMMGAVIGKAMDSLHSGNGVIEVLVRLQ